MYVGYGLDSIVSMKTWRLIEVQQRLSTLIFENTELAQALYLGHGIGVIILEHTWGSIEA